jgi:hypothetical protein
VQLQKDGAISHPTKLPDGEKRMIIFDGEAHSSFLRSVTDALKLNDGEEAKKKIIETVERLKVPEEKDLSGASYEDRQIVQNDTLDSFSDDEINYVNSVLPWSSFVVDKNRRVLGNRYSGHKRSGPDAQNDPRITRLSELSESPDTSSVAEYGCFEGHHTIQLCETFGTVFATDGRIENCIKTLVRSWMMGYQPEIRCLQLEDGDTIPPSVDISHHVGVLYHLTDPVTHLRKVLKNTGDILLLDTQIATDSQVDTEIDIEGRATSVYKFREKNIEYAPFAGMRSHAIWLRDATISEIATLENFDVVEQNVVEQRNGMRGTYYIRRRN